MNTIFCETFLTIVCGPFLRVEAEIGKCSPFELIVLANKFRNFIHVLSFLIFPQQCQLNVSIDTLASDRAAEVFVKVPLNTVPSFTVTTCLFLDYFFRMLNIF